jgi:hypothetical protein
MEHIELNKKELSYLSDTDFLTTKFTIIDKIIKLYAATEQQLKPILESNKHHLQEKWLHKTGKISKGENYRKLPYVVLDYPRFFNKDEVFAFRSMFWWGNFFSCTMHLQGDWLDDHRSRILHRIKKQSDFYLCINESPWEYHFGEDNYKEIEILSHTELENVVMTHPFIKISKKIGIGHWKEVTNFSKESLKLMLELIVE